MRWSAIVPLLVFALSACAPKPMRQVRAFWASDFVTYQIARVVVFPIQEDTKGQDSTASRILTSSLIRELRKKAPYEIIEADMDAIQELAPVNPSKKGIYRTDSLIAAGKRYRADAILFGQVTAVRPYYPQALGLRAEMVSVETGATLWSVDAMYDAADADVENAVRQHYEASASHYTDTEDWSILLNSPTRFANFVAARCVDALWKPEKKRSYKSVQEDLEDRR